MLLLNVSALHVLTTLYRSCMLQEWTGHSSYDSLAVAAFGPHWAIVIPVRIISLEIVIPVGPKFNQQEVEQLIRNIN